MNLTISLFGDVDTHEIASAFMERPVKLPESYPQREFKIKGEIFNLTFHLTASFAEYRIGLDQVAHDLMEVSDVIAIYLPSDNVKVIDYSSRDQEILSGWS